MQELLPVGVVWVEDTGAASATNSLAKIVALSAITTRTR
jgi:hypothetical protein